jgi:hypothetical protein
MNFPISKTSVFSCPKLPASKEIDHYFLTKLVFLSNSSSSFICSAMENITLNAIYNRPLAMFSEIVEHITLSVQLILAPIIIYVVFQNKKINIYRYYLINTIFWNTLSQIGNTLFSLSFLTPYPIIVFNSALESYIDKSTFYTLFYIWATCLVATLFGVLIASTYRFLYLLNLFESAKFIDNPVKLAITLAIAPLAFFIIVWFVFNIERETILSDIELSKTLPLVYKELQGRKYIGEQTSVLFNAVRRAAYLLVCGRAFLQDKSRFSAVPAWLTNLFLFKYGL